jgi:hypothetical protein
MVAVKWKNEVTGEPSSEKLLEAGLIVANAVDPT